MASNFILNNAKYSSNTDEWYTTYKTIAEELIHYEAIFRNKVVLCNCDNPFKSRFTYYFLRNFNRLGLKKLICTSCVSPIDNFAGSIEQLSLPLDVERVDERTTQKGLVLIVNEMPDVCDAEVKDEVITKFLNKQGVVRELNGNGDFRSAECLEYLKECDICCTNPPFSLFADLFSLLVKYKKQYLLIGNQNAITYKEIFPYIKENKAWVGYRFGDMAFRVPNDTIPRKTRFWIDKSGQKWRSLGNAMWLTNLDIPKRHVYLQLTKKYIPEEYPKYDNYDAINVSKVADIPLDYYGVMGVPITFLKYHNGLQFEILGEANHGSDNQFDLFKPKIKGKDIFKRILIRRVNCGVDKQIAFNILDLFCGAGGFSYGMDKNPRFHTAVAVDFDDKATETFKKNIVKAEVVVGDLTNEEVKNNIIAISKRKKVNMIIGGPPCQGYSMKGKKMGLRDPRNFLFREYLNIVRELQPEVFVIENVKGILLSSNGWFKDEIVNEVSNLGYKIEYGVLNAADFGVPQARERAIFICSRGKAISLPERKIEKYTTVWEAIGDLAYLESGEGEFKQEYTTEAMSEYQNNMRYGSQALYNHKASNHKKIAIEKLKMIPPEQGKEFIPEEMRGKQKFRTTWGRLKWDDVSPTIDTRFDAASNGTNNHPYLHRAITPREAARLQSFDDKFVFYGSKVYVRKQIGNAVPPLLAKAIADKIDESYNN